MIFLLVSFSLLFGSTEPVKIGQGREPEASVDRNGTIRIIFGYQDKVYYARSVDTGKSFSVPVVVAAIPGMHLGMERGPQLATSANFSIVTATDKQGNIHSMLLDHATDKWKNVGRVNDIEAIAKEGLMDMSADDHDNFFAVWLDLRTDNKNNIAWSSFSSKNGWQKNRIIYTSPEGKVCECCRPSIAVGKESIAVMFRNNISGSRDLYLLTSRDFGKTFTQASKLGEGTWKLEACPMDGGGVVIDKAIIRTVWQRENQVFASEPGMPEVKLANGRSPRVAASENKVVYMWNDGGSIIVKEAGKNPSTVGTGVAGKVLFIDSNRLLTVWESDNSVVSSKINL